MYDILDTRSGKIKEEAIENKQEEGTRAQHTPPRMVVLNEYPRKPPVKERVGLMKSAKRTAQKTLPAKERLGTKPSDFRQNNPGPSNPQNRDSRAGGATGSICSINVYGHIIVCRNTSKIIILRILMTKTRRI